MRRSLNGPIDIISQANGEVISWSAAAGAWENQPVSLANLGDVGDVVITTPADNEVLAYDTGSGLWINQTAAEASLAEASHTHDASDVISGTFDDARISESSITQHEGAIDHDALTNWVQNEHLDWTQDLGATNINSANIQESAVTQFMTGWTAWSPAFSGGNGVTLSGGSSTTEAAYVRMPTPGGDDWLEFYGLFSILINASGGSVTLTLPAATSIPNNTYIGSGQRSTGSWATRDQLIVMKQGSVMFLEAEAGDPWASSTTYLVGVQGKMRVS